MLRYSVRQDHPHQGIRPMEFGGLTVGIPVPEVGNISASSCLVMKSITLLLGPVP
ncbi:MAG TPA: hypothetical protein GXZ43_00905 [Clostridiaceae bacterium]|nr:hypothetical protein [Clostridiaceae bacterium]